MGIFGALTTAVTGMRAQSFALENISGNIANSQTTAYKREDTSFVDLIPDNIPSKQLAGNVVANSRSTNSVQGDIQNASVGTYMAINGQGFFVVEKPASFADNLPVFDGIDLYTRRGDFSTDKNGYLVNGAGYYLMGIPVDAMTGNLVGSVPTLLKFDSGFLPAQPTTQIQYQANLASYPLTAAHDTGIPQSELLNPARLQRRSDGRRHRHRGRQRRDHVPEEFGQRRRHHRLRRFGLAGERATALGQDRQLALRRHRHLEPVLSDRLDRHRPAAWRGRTSASTTPSPPTARCRRRSRS